LTNFEQALKFGWNAIFTPNSVKQGSLDVSREVIETIIDRSRSISGEAQSSNALCDAGSALLEGQQSTATSFNIEQPLVSTRLLNGSVLDFSTSEDHVQAIAASWNESRYLSRVAHAAPIFAACVTLSPDSLCLACTDKFSRKPMHTSRSNDAEWLCCGDGGMLLLCDFCPASYHLECAGIEQVVFIFPLPLYKCCAITFPAQVPARQWMCPHHTCVGCGKKAHECSNCLFRLLLHDFPLSIFIIVTRADARIVLFHFVKTVNPTACRCCQQANVASLAK